MKDDGSISDADMDLAEELFCRAIGIESAEERRACLDGACGGNDALRAFVQRLLDRHAETEDFFNSSVPTRISAVEVSQTLSDIPEFFEQIKSALPDDEQVGMQIGPYKLLQKLGEGGVGNVYLAEQGSPVRRQVALKIIKAGMDTKSVIARFEAERQALAMMEHPNIAHVLGAGETEAGRPFFVMELVHGIRITTYCEENRLDVVQRLKLFIQVCHAIRHAHQKGIIHRDVKPSNVLVTSFDHTPMPMVIDFGIAKATTGDPLSDRTAYTLSEQFIGTPAYMSPEQAQATGLDVDTRSDIYSLGALLYELLTGAPPFDQEELMKQGLDEMRRILREKEPLRPSVRFHRLSPDQQGELARNRQADPRRLEAMLHGDLDWIVMQALEKNRARRYETVDAFAMDIERFLANEPVTARPPSRRYRLKKMVLRNRGVFGAVGGISAALVVGFAISTWLFIKERSARQRAVSAELLAEEARANEAGLRRQAEAREKIAQAAFSLSRGFPEQADGLIDALPLSSPSIEGAAVLRQLGTWHALNGDRERAIDCYRKLLRINALNDLETQSLDFLVGAVVFADSGAAAEYAALRQEVLARHGDNLPSLAAARMLMASLLLPADDVTIQALKPLAHFVIPQFPAETANPPQAADSDDLWQRLQLVSVASDSRHELKHSGEAVTFIAGGENIWDNRDSFAFANMLITGDFDLRLRIHSIHPLDAYTRAGLMARSALTDPGSRHIMVAVNAENTYQVLVRSRDDATTASLPPNPLPEARGADSWVRLQRVGAVFRGYSSDNGRDWVLLDAYDSAIGAEGPMANSIYVGIAACAHSPEGLTEVMLSDFSIPSIRSVDALLATALMQYRSGEYSACLDSCRSCLSHPELNAAGAAILRVLFAHSFEHLGESATAGSQLDQAREMIGIMFTKPLDEGGESQGYWYDWLVARILLNETSLP